MPATTWSGSQGDMMVGTAHLLVKTWTLNDRATLAETTNAQSGGFETHKKVKRGADLTAEVEWDSTATPESLSLRAGDEFVATLQIGGSALKFSAVPFIVESRSLKGCTQDGIVTYDLAAKSNGVITDPA